VYHDADSLFVNEIVGQFGRATPPPIRPKATFGALMAAVAQAAESEDLGLQQTCAG